VLKKSNYERQKKEASHKFGELMRSLEIYKWHQKGIKNDVHCRQTFVNQGFFVGFTSFHP